MDIFKAIANCLTGYEEPYHSPVITESKHTYASSAAAEQEDHLASEILNILFTAEKSGQEINARLKQTVHTTGWTESLAKKILDGLVAALESGAVMGGAMKDAFDRASEGAEKFVHKHPVFTAVVVTVVAIGILALLAPWVVEALGFGEFGPVPGRLDNHFSQPTLLKLMNTRIIRCVVAVDDWRCRGWVVLLVAAEAGYDMGKEVSWETNY